MSGAGPVRVTSPWRRGRARRKLQRGVRDLAAKATREHATVWRVQPIVEVCTDAHYAAWRNARERAWKRDDGKFRTRTWPERLIPGEWGGVLLPQSHGGHYRGQPTEIATPVFSHGLPVSGRDVEQPYDSLVLGLLVAGCA